MIISLTDYFLLLEQVLSRTMADVLCDVTQLNKIQKWVTLQPNRNYNTHKSCSTNHKLDMKAIADEITKELLGSREARGGRFPQRGGRFPERTRFQSGRSVTRNRIRNLISKTQRPRKSSGLENTIQNKPRLRSVRFEKTDAIPGPPQLSSQAFRPLRSEQATGGIGDTRFRSTGRTLVNTKPRRSENFSFSVNPRGFKPQVAVNSFIEKQQAFSSNTFSLRENNPNNSNLRSSSSSRSKKLNRFVPSSDCFFGICR